MVRSHKQHHDPKQLIIIIKDTYTDGLQGWPIGMLKEAFEKCPNMKGNVADCPVFAPYLNPDTARNCEMFGDIVNEPVGLDTRLPKLPGNNPSFNSSRLANNPRRPDPNYRETAAIVPHDKANGGACKSNECTDYKGPRDAPPATAPAPPQQPAPQQPSPQQPSPGTPGQPAGEVDGGDEQEDEEEEGESTATAPVTRAGTATTTAISVIGGGLNAAPSATGPVESDAEEVCTRRHRPSRPRPSKRRLLESY